MQSSGKWILGGLIGLLGLIGLFMASRAHDSTIYYVGLAFFVFAVLFNFGLIGRYTGNGKAH